MHYVGKLEDGALEKEGCILWHKSEDRSNEASRHSLLFLKQNWQKGELIV
jgi:hypothetical protein